MRTLRTIVATTILVSAFWLYFFMVWRAPASTPHGPAEIAAARPDGTVAAAGDKKIVPGGSGGPLVVAESVTVGPAGLAIPVAGVRADQLVDTFTQARAGGARRHDAIDIMAADGTPVVAAAAGTVEKLFFSPGGGGITAYIRSADGQWIYYYAHLQDYAPGLAEGQAIARGAPVGRVGHTGNANPAGPHLHFAIARMGAGEKWYDGTPVNPYPLLAGKPATR